MPRFTRILFAAVLAVTLSGGLAATGALADTPPPSTIHAVAKEKQLGYWLDAGPRLKAKYGHGKRFFGPIYLDGVLGDCVDYGKADPDGDWSTGAFGHVRGSVLRQQIQWVESKYWTSGLTSKTYAAARNSTVNRLKDADFRFDWARSYVRQFRAKDPRVAALSDRMLADAKKYAGLVKVSAVFEQGAQKKGDAGAVRVKVTANSRAYPGQALTWKATSARIASAPKATGKDGTALLRVVRTGKAPIVVTAAVVTPDWRRARFSTPTNSGRQHLVRGVGPVTTRVTVSHHAASIGMACTGGCDGRPAMTLTSTAGAVATQWRALDGKKQVASLALKVRQTKTARFTGADGHDLTIQYRTKVGARWTAWRTSQTFEVICPPWPKVTLECACDGALTVSLTPTGSRYYVATVGTKTVPLDGRTTITVPLKRGEAAGITVTAYSDAGRTKAIGTHTYGTWTQG